MSDIKAKLKGRKESEYIEAILFLLSDDISNRAISAVEKQIQHMVDFFENENITTNLDDKDDKTFDRSYKLLEKLPAISKQLQELKANSLNLEDKKTIKQSAAGNSIIRFISEQEKA